MNSKDSRILIFVVFLIIVAIGLGVVNTFFGNAIVGIKEVGQGDDPDQAGTDCSMDIDCPYNQHCFSCGVCGPWTCDYPACQAGHQEYCCGPGLVCQENYNCYCSGSGGSCFIQGTRILMVDKTEKNIEDVKVGDKVLSYNLETNKIEEDIVTSLKRPVHNDMIIIKFGNSENTNTFDHPYFVKGKGWSSYKPGLTMVRYGQGVKELQVVEQLEGGDIIFIVDEKGNLVESKIISIEESRGEIQTYIFTVEKNGNFFANGALVHNKHIPEPVDPCGRD
jgi:hypothetical protein